MKLVLLFVFCAVIETQSENSYGRQYGPFIQGYTRIKRVKYSNPPQRFYSRPPSSFSNSGVFSYTPPPGYSTEDEPAYPGNSYPGYSRPKVSKTPSNQGLGEGDIQNLVKYLSKQDLDKILEYSGHKDSERTRDPYEKYNDYRPNSDDTIDNNIPDLETYSSNPNEYNSKIYSALVKEIDLEPKFNTYQEKPSNELKYKPANNGGSSQLNYQENNKVYSNNQASYETGPKLSVLTDQQNDKYNAVQSIQRPFNSNTPYGDLPNSKVMQEEILPRPVNLRDEEDFVVSFTHNVAKVVRADPSYKLENFGDLPLMNYHSKLDTLSSYHVPHYTVTSSGSSSSSAEPSSSYAASSSSYSSSSSVPEVEPAPPSSAAKEQSDAHLKAVRIWSHKSKGTAYTLHDDGTLSLEKSGRPKGGYGYS